MKATKRDVNSIVSYFRSKHPSATKRSDWRADRVDDDRATVIVYHKNEYVGKATH